MSPHILGSEPLARLLLLVRSSMGLSCLHLPALASGVRASPEHACIDAYDRDLDYILTTLRRLGNKAEDIDDLAQEVFIILHKNWSTIDATRPLRPYLFGVAFRVSSANRRRRWREVPSEAVELRDESESPEAAMQRAQAADLLAAALDHLPLRRRAVIVLKDLEGVPVAEIARRLSMSRFGVYARLRKGRAELETAIRRLLTARGA